MLLIFGIAPSILLPQIKILKLYLSLRHFWCRYIDYLSTECEVCTGNYLHEVFVQCKKARGQILSRTDRTNEVNEEYGFLFLSSSASTKFCVHELAA